MFSSDELDYLATLLNVKLPTVKSTHFFSLSGASLKEVEKARKRIIQYQEKFQAWAGHDWSLLNNESEITKVKDRIKNTTTQNISPSSDLLKAFVDDLKKGTKPNQTILSDLEKHEKSIKAAITDIQKSAATEAKNRKERNGIIEKAKSAGNELMSAYIKANGALERVNEICTQTDVPEPRQKLLQTIKSVQEKSKKNITDLSTSEDFRNLSPLNPTGRSNTNITEMEEKAITLKKSFDEELTTLNDSIKQWDTQLTSLLPTIELFGNVKSTYRKYTALCTEMETTNLFPEQHKKISRKMLDAQYLKPFLESASNPKKSQEAVTNFEAFHKKWKEQLDEARKERDEATTHNSNANKQYDASAQFLDSTVLQTSKDYIIEINRLFSNCDFKAHNTKCTDFQTFMKDHEKRVSEGQELHKNWPLNKLTALTKEIEDLKSQIEGMSLEAPLRMTDLRNFINNILEMYKLDTSTKFAPSDYVEMINILVAKRDELKKFIGNVSNKEINKLHKDQSKAEKKRLNIIGEAGKVEEDIRKNQSQSADLESELQAITEKMNIVDSELEKAKKKQEKAQKESNPDKESKYKEIVNKLQSKADKLKKSKDRKEKQQTKNNKDLEALRKKLNAIQGDPKDPSVESELSRVEAELTSIQNSIEKETGTIIQEAFPQERVSEWNSRIQIFEEEIEKRKTKLEKNNALDLVSTILGPFTTDRNNIEKEWKHVQSDFFVMVKQNSETVPTETIGKESIKDLDALIVRVKSCVITAETIEAGKESKEKLDFTSQKNRFLQDISHLKENTEKSVIPDTLRDLEKKITDLSAPPNDWKKLEKELEKCKEEIKQNIEKQNGVKSQTFDTLCKLRKELQIKVEVRKEIALGQWKWFHEDLEYIRTAYTQLEKDIAVYEDSYLRSASTEPELTQGVQDAFAKLEQEIENFDTKGLGELAKEYKELSSSITNSLSLLSSAKTLKKCLPKSYESLDTEIKAIKNEQKTTSLRKLQKRFALWSSFFTTENGEANRISEQIKTLLTSSTKLHDEISNHGGYEAHTDFRASLLKSLGEITESKVQTSAQFNTASEIFEDIMGKHKKCLTSAEAMDAEGALFLEQEASKERSKKDWEAFIKEYENKVMSELKKLVAKQKSNPELDKGEIQRLDDALKNAQEAIKTAKKAGEKGSYREGRMNLKKISAIMATLQKYPNGVNAHRSKNLNKTQEMWVDSIKKVQSHMDALKKFLAAKMNKENIDAKHISTVEESIDKFVNGLHRNTFTPAIQLLDGGGNLEAGREMGLGTVRDIRNDLGGPSGTFFLDNPFQKMDVSAIYKTLDSIEKTFLLYR